MCVCQNAVINCWIRQEHMAEQFLYFFLPLFTAWLIICTIAIRCDMCTSTFSLLFFKPSTPDADSPHMPCP